MNMDFNKNVVLRHLKHWEIHQNARKTRNTNIEWIFVEIHTVVQNITINSKISMGKLFKMHSTVRIVL